MSECLKAMKKNVPVLKNKSHLHTFNIMKMICDNPRRITIEACRTVGLSEGLTIANSAEAYPAKTDVDIQTLLRESGKLQMLGKVIDVMLPEKILIFTNYRKNMHIIGKILESKKVNYVRFSGQDSNWIRTEQIKRFQEDLTVKVFLMTTTVGSNGLAVTAATRIIFYDADWNPEINNQAASQLCRIGRQRNVVVLRLHTTNSIEEVIYKRQLFKKYMIGENKGETKDQYRIFSEKELRLILEQNKIDKQHLSGENTF